MDTLIWVLWIISILIYYIEIWHDNWRGCWKVNLGSTTHCSTRSSSFRSSSISRYCLSRRIKFNRREYTLNLARIGYQNYTMHFLSKRSSSMFDNGFPFRDINMVVQICQAYLFIIFWSDEIAIMFISKIYFPSVELFKISSKFNYGPFCPNITFSIKLICLKARDFYVGIKGIKNYKTVKTDNIFTDKFQPCCYLNFFNFLFELSFYQLA